MCLVQRGERLIEQENVRCGGQRADDAAQLLHAAGHVAHAERKQLARLQRQLLRHAHARDRAEIAQIVGEGHVFQQRRALRHIADLAVSPDLAVRRAQNARGGGEQRGFAAAVRAAEGDGFARGKLQLDMLQNNALAVGKTEIVDFKAVFHACSLL